MVKLYYSASEVADFFNESEEAIRQKIRKGYFGEVDKGESKNSKLKITSDNIKFYLRSLIKKRNSSKDIKNLTYAYNRWMTNADKLAIEMLDKLRVASETQ